MTLFSALQRSNNHQVYNSGFRIGLLTIVATCLLLLLVELSIGPSKSDLESAVLVLTSHPGSLATMFDSSLALAKPVRFVLV